MASFLFGLADLGPILLDKERIDLDDFRGAPIANIWKHLPGIRIAGGVGGVGESSRDLPPTGRNEKPKEPYRSLNRPPSGHSQMIYEQVRDHGLQFTRSKIGRGDG